MTLALFAIALLIVTGFADAAALLIFVIEKFTPVRMTAWWKVIWVVSIVALLCAATYILMLRGSELP
jgi:hypothetical protein